MSDPIASIIISLLILTTTITLLKDTSKILLMHVPYSGKKVLAAISHDVFKNYNLFFSLIIEGLNLKR